jgi:dUTP pyrophosphatase
MKIQILKNETYTNESQVPKKGTQRSTGYDIIASSEPEIVGELNANGSYKRIDYIQYKTNLKLAVQTDRTFSGFGHTDIDYDILAFPRSSVSKYNLVLANSIGLIDADYRGEVLLRFKYIWQPEDYNVYTHESGDGSPLYTYIGGKPNVGKIYKKGDKICQLKVTRVEHVEFFIVDELDSTNRGEGGFGSTDKKVEQNLDSIMASYKKQPVYTPEKKYIDLIKEREELNNNL